MIPGSCIQAGYTAHDAIGNPGDRAQFTAVIIDHHGVTVRNTADFSVGFIYPDGIIALFFQLRYVVKLLIDPCACMGGDKLNRVYLNQWIGWTFPRFDVFGNFRNLVIVHRRNLIAKDFDLPRRRREWVRLRILYLLAKGYRWLFELYLCPEIDLIDCSPQYTAAYNHLKNHRIYL